MSQWTHVAGVLRIDAIRLRGLPGQLADPLDPPTKLLGFMTPEIDYDVEAFDQVAWDRCNIPCGSEGSLRYHVWANPSLNDLAAYSVMFWGDLRDYSDVQAIVRYFKSITEQVDLVRQGVFTVDIEGDHTYTYIHQESRWVRQ